MGFERIGCHRLYRGSYSKKSSPLYAWYSGDKNKNRRPDPDELTYSRIKTGDFRDDECIEILKQADIVVTNPPFSLFREYVAQLIEYKKKFLIIGNKNAIAYKEIFALIKAGKMWLGMTHPKVFVQPDGTEQAFGNICWFTNLPHSNRNKPLDLWRSYKGHKKDYPKYDNCKAIEVSKVAYIPKGYPGVMGVPITFLGKHNPEQFEIVGQMVTTKVDEFDKGYPYVGGKKIYARILSATRNRRRNMKIELQRIPIRQVIAGYKDNAEEGVRGYGGRLDVRPPYQREFIYKQDARCRARNYQKRLPFSGCSIG